MTQYILNNWLASVFGSLFFLGFLLAKRLFSHHISKNIQYWMLLFILLRFLWIAPITIWWANTTPIITYKNELTTQIQKPVENIQQTFTTPNPKPQSTPIVQQEAIPQTMTPSPSFSFQRQWLLAVFPLVSAGIFLYHLVGYRRFCGLLQKTFQQPSPMAAQIFQAVCADLHISNRLRLLETPILSSPLCIGLFRPTIMIPTGIHTEKELRNILYHELTHYKNKDVWVKWLTLVAVSLHFFNPLVYWLRKELNLYGELRCDERVIATMAREEKQYYGELLIQMASQQCPIEGRGLSGMSQEKQSLKERLVAIMEYKKKSRWIKVISAAVVGMTALCLIFTGMTFANDWDAIKTQSEKVSIQGNQSKWIDFPQKLKGAQLLPASLVDRCNKMTTYEFSDDLCWEDDGNGGGVMILLSVRGEELRSYRYSNGGFNNVVEELHPIDTTQAVEKSLEFLKTYNIGTPELAEKLAKGTVDRNQITLQPVETGSPNYPIMKITMQLGEKDQYAFKVDMNMGAIIGFENVYEQQLIKRDVYLFDYTSAVAIKMNRGDKIDFENWYEQQKQYELSNYAIILNGCDYIDKVQPGQTYLWTNEKGEVWVDAKNPDDTGIHTIPVATFESKAQLNEALKSANNTVYFPPQFDFREAKVEYYFTVDNVDYAHPVKTVKVSDDVYFKVYDVKGDYTKNIKQILIAEADGKDGIGFRYGLASDDFNYYNRYEPGFRLTPVPITMKAIAGNTVASTQTNDSNNPVERRPVQTITPIPQNSFDRAILEELAYDDGDVHYTIDAIKHIAPIECYDHINESKRPGIETFTGVEVFYFSSDKNNKEKMLEWFQ